MKQLLELNNDFFIKSKFIADTVRNEQTGYYDPVWVDDTKTKATGRECVEQVQVLIPIYDREGYLTGNFQLFAINKQDVLALADKIKEIDAIRREGIADDNLPF